MPEPTITDSVLHRLPERLLLGPGPSPVPARVLKAMAAPPIGYLDPAWFGVLAQVQNALRSVFQTDHRCTLSVSGTGTAGMQACVAALVEPGDSVVVGVNGYFGNRLTDMAQRRNVLFVLAALGAVLTGQGVKADPAAALAAAEGSYDT